VSALEARTPPDGNPSGARPGAGPAAGPGSPVGASAGPSPIVLALAAAAAIGALLAPGAPTSVVVIDGVYRAALGALVVLAASRARPWAWIWIAALATIGSQGWGLGVGVLIVVVAVAGSFVRRPERAAVDVYGPAIGAGVAAVAVQLLLRMPSAGLQGSTAALAALAIVPVLVSGYRRVSRRSKRRIRLATAIGFLFVLVFSASAAIAGLVSWRHAATAIDASHDSLDAARDGKQPETIRHLDDANAAFAQAHDTVTAWWARPAWAVPVVARYLAAADVSSEAGSNLTRATRDAASIANIDDLRPKAGRIDVDMIRRLRDPVAHTSEVARELEPRLANIETDWFVGPMRSRMEQLRTTAADAAHEGDLAVATLDRAPGFLGADGIRQYLIVFASPSETRELGGFMGNFGLLTADHGKLTLVRIGRSTTLNDQTAGRPVAPDLPARYAAYDIGRHWQNITGTPDFPTVARTAAALFPADAGTKIDGVAYIDPYVLAAFMKFTGPVTVDALGGTLNASNVTDFLLREQYSRFPDKAERVDFLEGVANTTFDRLTTGDLPGPRDVSTALSPVIDGHHLLLWSAHEDEQRYLRDQRIDGALPAPTGDFLEVTQANANPNKLDAYLHRTIRYAVQPDPASGAVKATATVELHSDAPTGLSSYVSGNLHSLPSATNYSFVSLYTPWQLDGLTVDGQAVPVEKQGEYGRWRYGAFVTIPRDKTVTMAFALSGQTGTLTSPVGSDATSQPYRLLVNNPPMVHPDRLIIEIGAPTGATGAAPGPGTATVTLPDGTKQVGAGGRVQVDVAGGIAVFDATG
jgi:Protein of unknown function (DUF4012)